MLLTPTFCTRRASTPEPILTEPHAQRRHGQRLCTISGTVGGLRVRVCAPTWRPSARVAVSAGTLAVSP
jgi:hypothetical protein